MSNKVNLADAVRALSMDAVQAAKCGHPGMPMGMAEIALVLWTKHLKHNPKNPDFYNNIGMSYSSLYKYKKAEDFYNKGLKINQNNLEILNNLGNLKKNL